MIDVPRILAFAGSAREGSFNRKLIRIAAAAAREAGADVTLIELRDYPLPLYNGDLEAAEGLPENAMRLKTLLSEHHGLLIACPEYNSGMTPLLKNTIDWASRSVGGSPGLAWTKGKVAGLVSASPSALGGLRGLYHTRWVLENIGIFVVPRLKAVTNAPRAFDAEGNLVDEKDREAVRAVAQFLTETVQRLAG